MPKQNYASGGKQPLEKRISQLQKSGLKYLIMDVHQEATVSREAQHGGPRMGDSRGDGGRNAVAHRAAGRRELRAVFAPAPEPVHPAGVVAGAICNDRVGWKLVANARDDFGELDGTGVRDGRTVGEVILVHRLG